MEGAFLMQTQFMMGIILNGKQQHLVHLGLTLATQ